MENVIRCVDWTFVNNHHEYRVSGYFHQFREKDGELVAVVEDTSGYIFEIPASKIKFVTDAYGRRI